LKVCKIKEKNFERNLTNISLILSSINSKSRHFTSLKKEVSDLMIEIQETINESKPVSVEQLNLLLFKLNEVLRFFVSNGIEQEEYVKPLNRIFASVKNSIKASYYDFFRICGSCPNCCTSLKAGVIIFSFETEFIEKYGEYLNSRDYVSELKRAGNGVCCMYDEKKKKCRIYDERPLDCRIFPYSFYLETNISHPDPNVRKNYLIFLVKAINCAVVNKLRMTDTLRALELSCYILSNISFNEALEYSRLVDPTRMAFDLIIPYDQKDEYSKALNNILGQKIIN